MKVFLDEHKEISYKKCVDVFELAQLLKSKEFGAEIDLNPVLTENLGNILRCFGEIEYEPFYGERIPEDTEEEKRIKAVAAIKA